VTITSQVIDSAHREPEDTAGPQGSQFIAVKETIVNHATASPIATFHAPSPLLRRTLLIDAALAFLSGIALTLASDPLAELLQLPVTALRACGLLFLPFAALAGWLGTRDRVHRPLVFFVIALNALFSVDLVILLLGGWLQTNRLGELFVATHAVIIAVLAEMEVYGLRRSTRVDAYARR
jgi:hypothetical protein